MSGLRSVGGMQPDSLEDRIFVGTVVQNDDTTSEDGKKRQRIKVTVPGVLDEADGYSEATLPWCSPKAAVGDYQGTGWGEVDVPSIGATVSIEFQDGRIDFPLYSPGHVEADPPTPLTSNYPNRRGRVLKNGAHYWVDETSGEMEYLLANGYRVYVDGAGNATINIPLDCNITVGGNYNLHVVGNKTVTVDGNESLNVTGNKTAQVNGSDSLNVTGDKTDTIGGNRISNVTGVDTTNASDIQDNP